jgi:hypothetical protein
MKAIPGSLVAAALLPLSFTALGASMPGPMAARDLPAAIGVPAGKPAMTLKGVGKLTYECRAKAGASDAFEWAFVGPDALLQEMGGRTVGKYYGGPTWEHSDGSKITGKQLAVAPGGSGNIPLQLVQTSPATGSGAFSGVTYIQRINTQGGVAPASPCNASAVSSQQTVEYSADYVFYK